MTTIGPAQMSDAELLGATARAVHDERRATSDLLALLGELDVRRLYLGLGCSSLFTYCTQVLHLSEHAAYHRIEAARAARQYPMILELLADGQVTLTTVAMLRPHLSGENHKTLLEAARHKSKRAVEYQLACLTPKPDAKPLIRRIADDRKTNGELPQAWPCLVDAVQPALAETATPMPIAQGPAPKVVPLAVDRYLLRVTLSADAHAKLRRAQDLMRHTEPNGDPAIVIDRALTLLVQALEKGKVANVSKPRGPARALPATERAPESVTNRRSRYIPAAVQRAVWQRDQGRCAFVGSGGRCTETGRLEFHHVTPFAHGGPPDVANIALRCRAHNTFEGEQIFGAWSGANSVRTELA